MHDGQASVDAALVRRLVAGQFPQLAGLPVIGISSPGTVNAIYRIGDDWYARLPLLEKWQSGLEYEARWLPWLAPRLTLAIPEPVWAGRPAEGYPFGWAIYRWLDGSPYADDLVDDEGKAAADLARFVTELRQVEPVSEAPRTGRRPLEELDVTTQESFAAAAGAIDVDGAFLAWQDSLRAAPWDGSPVWIHSDLLRPNVLVHNGRISAVIDFGAVGVGDPATDVIAAWAVFGPAGRVAFRAALGVDDDTWRRSRGIALHQAVALIPYYAESNPAFAALGRRTARQVIADFRDGG
jgi:aminoglycoside phosphotransferase (APT) family kinase protein